MDIFVIGLCVLCVICSALFFYGRSALPTITNDSFKSFQRSYLIVYILAMAGDWLQGPYVYALYANYKMTTHDIEILFVMGFGSSMIFGTFIGSFADKFGRKANCILYAILYGLSCITKHFNNFTILLVGRLLGGIATSILYSAFESWVICEHHKRGFDASLLGSIFSHAVLGNSIAAITSGLVAQQAANFFGYVAPFDISLIVLSLLAVIIYFTWVENHGDASATTSQSFGLALQTIKSDHKVLCLGLIQSLFEGSMYTFVLEWTPALTPPEIPGVPVKSIPHGYIFAAFMIAMMIGSSLFNILRKKKKVPTATLR